MLDLKCYQDKIGAWACRNFPTVDRVGEDKRCLQVTLGVSEEAGELAHAILKMDQGIRGTNEEHIAEAQDALGDIMVYMCNLCDLKGWNLEETFKATADKILKRDWVKDPVHGGEDA